MALYGRAWSVSRPGRFTQWIEDGLETVMKTKIPSPCRDPNSRSISQPTAIPLRYPGSDNYNSKNNKNNNINKRILIIVKSNTCPFLWRVYEIPFPIVWKNWEINELILLRNHKNKLFRKIQYCR